MTPFEMYSLVVCLIVYVLLVSVGALLVVTIYKQSIKLIKSGADDEILTKEYEKQKSKKKSGCALDCVVSGLLCLVLLVAFAFSAYVSLSEDAYFEEIPTFKVVNSSSMAKKNEKNTYLFENNLNNQFATFDMILTYKLPKEEDIQLYDIVVYEIDDILVVHRIVGIEEPNERHPDERWFTCQGDAISQTDRFPVRYSQMHAIYRNEKIPFVGSFVAFMQSPAGYICILLVVFAMICTPLMENKLNKEKQERLSKILPKREPVADGSDKGE